MHLHIFTMCKQLSFYFSMCFEGSPQKRRAFLLREIFPSILLCSHVLIKRKLFTGVEVFVFMSSPRVWEHPQSHTFRRTHLCMNLPYNIMWETLNRPKKMNAVSTKALLPFFPPVCPFAPSIFFSSDTQACFALVTSYITAYFAPVK